MRHDASVGARGSAPSARWSQRCPRLLVVFVLSQVALFAGTHFSFPLSVFSHDNHPSPPLAEYAAGDLGIVVPSYARSYLYTAYRWMDGAPMTPEEQTELVTYWNIKLEIEEEPVETDGGLWFDLRESLSVPLGPALDFDTIAVDMGPNYVEFLRCHGHGFQLAGERLQSHIDRFGRESREVREWVLAQDVVFSNCGRSGLVPEPAPADIDPVIRRDRTYQVAAARFLARRHDEAAGLFRRIAPDPSWPGGLWAPYMAGRSLLWDARLTDEGPARDSLLRRALVQFESVLQQDNLAPTHDAARFLLIRILMLTDQQAAARLLGLRLMSPLRAGSRQQDLRQYFKLLDNTLDPGWNSHPSTNATELSARDAMTDWVVTFQGRRPDEREHSFARWRESGTTAWLIASLRHAEATDSIAPELLAAADSHADGPGLATVRYFQAQLLIKAGKRAEAARLLDSILPTLEGRRPSSANRAAALRVEAADSIEGALQYGLRKPAGYGTMSSSGPYSSLWGSFAYGKWGRESYDPVPDSIQVHPALADAFNTAMPVDEFASLALSDREMPDWLRQEVVVTAWIRAVLLERWELAESLARAARTDAQQTAQSMEEYLAAPPASRLFVAQLILLRFPGVGVEIRSGIGRHAPLDAMQLDGLNWWWWKDGYESGLGRRPQQPNGWTTPTQRMQATLEWKRIIALGEGHDWLYGAILKRCQVNEPEPQCAEALYRAGVSRVAIGYWHDPAWLDFDYGYLENPAGQVLQLFFSTTPWARNFGKDVAWAEGAWRAPEGEVGRRSYLRYPR